MSLSDLRYRGGRMSYPASRMTAPEWKLPEYIDEAKSILQQVDVEITHLKVREMPKMTSNFEKLRWFVLPQEAQKELMQQIGC